MNLHGTIIVGARGDELRVFSPGPRFWLWIPFLLRHVIIARVGGSLLPRLAWISPARIEIMFGTPPRKYVVRVERVPRSARSSNERTGRSRA